jgi:hypothetical protein
MESQRALRITLCARLALLNAKIGGTGKTANRVHRTTFVAALDGAIQSYHTLPFDAFIFLCSCCVGAQKSVLEKNSSLILSPIRPTH